MSMKSTKEIIGLRIISISDGAQVGIVKDMIFNSQSKTMDFIIVDQPADYLGAKVIAFSDILGIGEFAIMIPHTGVIQDVAQVREAQNLLKQDIRVLGTKVLTKKGQLIGEVQEIIINEETSQIAVCQFESDGERHEIGANQIITLGRELLIVESDTNTNSVNLENMDLINQAQDEAEPEIQIEMQNENEIQTETDLEPLAESKMEVQAPLPDISTDVGLERDLTEKTEPSFNLFEQRQLQFFIGRRTEKDIILDNGMVLKAGDIITPECVTHITTRNTLMEVTSHLQKS